MNEHDGEAGITLPELSDERVDEMESALFDEIGRERSAARRHSARRTRWWIAGGAAAAIVTVAAIIAPGLGGLVMGSSSTSDSAAEPAYDLPREAADGSVDESGAGVTAESDASGELESSEDSDTASTGERAIITTASAAITVDDVEAAARAIGNAAVAHDGYIESMNIGTTGDVMPAEGVATDTVPYPYTDYPYSLDGGWISVRVPATELAPLIEELSDVGDVTSSSIDRADVTAQSVDLQARVDAAAESVDRLTEIMAEAGDLSDLIAAESALAERQALLESYQQELKMLDDQVAMSTLSVTLSPTAEPVVADPAGFADGLAAGWNGLLATLNGIVIALGFLLPWVAIGVIAAAIVWLIVRGIRRRRAPRAE